MNRSAITLAACIGLSACANMKPPSPAEIAAANYGPAPTQEAAEQGAKDFLNRGLKDPYSAQWDCNPVYKGWLKDAAIYGGQVYYGWRLDCTVNAKNSYGGYTGGKTYNFLYSFNILEHVYGETSTSNGLGSYMDKLL